VDVKVGDFNGDGKADITGRVGQNGQWWTAVSNGHDLYHQPVGDVESQRDLGGCPSG